MNLTSYIVSLGLSHGETKQVECPSCGKDKLSVTRHDDGTYVWNCFSASCKLKGVVEAKGIGKATRIIESKDTTKELREVPYEHFKNINDYPDALVYLDKFGIKPLNDHLSNTPGDAYIKYDIRLDRVVFTYGKMATGRLLKGKGAKWYRYDNSNDPFYCSAWADELIIVEDCISAYKHSTVWYDTLALLGTEFHESYIPYIKRHSKVYICLDRDASDKALKLAQLLSWFVPSKAIILTKDPKEYTIEELRGLINA